LIFWKDALRLLQCIDGTLSCINAPAIFADYPL